MTSSDNFQNDDKTIIGKGISFESPGPNDENPKDGKEKDARLVGSSDNTTRTGMPITPNVMPDSDKTVVGMGLEYSQLQHEQTPSGPAPPIQEKDMWFVAEMQGKEYEYPLQSNVLVTVGRESDQDIVIDDRTLSRKHLTVRRSGDHVHIQILGLNGLVHNGITHKSTTIDLSAPSSFSIGRVACQIRKKIDVDATILMSDPAQFSADQDRQKFKPVSAPGPSQSMPHPAPEEGNAPIFPEKQSAPEAIKTPPLGGPSTFSPNTADDHSQNEISFEPKPFSENVSGSGFENFSEQNAWTDSFSGQASGKRLLSGAWLGKLSPYYKYIMAGAVLLIIIVFCIFLFSGDESAPVRQNLPPLQEQQSTTLPNQVIPPSTPSSYRQTSPSVGTKSENYNLYSRYYNEAYKLYNEGEMAMACDYLKDIPHSSPVYDRAVNLAKQIGNCDLND